ncbi:hypothetical protein [Roseibium aggregatum]|uniref:hypothetical protein n=1 Tax=Roseibium aggregatum TaxID=187304 RepID=UPI001E4280CB|nr:hypothetical protein [Roseibium aggregatum]UES51656.1 hypothetical protein GFK88_19755 [Roseibium aggregatum]
MRPNTEDFLVSLSIELSRLYGFARQMNELDFAVSLSGEFRGMQDAGWLTPITARQVFEEIKAYEGRSQPYTLPEWRIVLLLYCQLAEAGGVYESLKNILGIISALPYNSWPFQGLVRTRQIDDRIIAPNANATFKDLAQKAKHIGMAKLSDLLAITFDDEIRNGIAHADYVIWTDGSLRLSKRNGGLPKLLKFEEVADAVAAGVGFYEILQLHNSVATRSFNPAKEIVGKLSEFPPMKHTVFADPEKKIFSIKSSSSGVGTTPEYLRQVEINTRLGGRILTVFPRSSTQADESIIREIEAIGYEPNIVPLDVAAYKRLTSEIDALSLRDDRNKNDNSEGTLLLSPFGYCSVASMSQFDLVFPNPMIEFEPQEAHEPSAPVE